MSRKPIPVRKPKLTWTCADCGYICDQHWRFCGRCEAPRPIAGKREGIE